MKKNEVSCGDDPPDHPADCVTRLLTAQIRIALALWFCVCCAWPAFGNAMLSGSALTQGVTVLSGLCVVHYWLSPLRRRA